MKIIIIALIALISFSQAFGQSAGNDTTKYIYYRYTYGNALDRYWAKKVLMAPADTVFSKDGLAILAGILYVGNGVKWTAASSGAGVGTLTQVTFNSNGTPYSIRIVDPSDTTLERASFHYNADNQGQLDLETGLGAVTKYQMDSIVVRGRTYIFPTGPRDTFALKSDLAGSGSNMANADLTANGDHTTDYAQYIWNLINGSQFNFKANAASTADSNANLSLDATPGSIPSYSISATSDNGTHFGKVAGSSALGSFNIAGDGVNMGFMGVSPDGKVHINPQGTSGHAVLEPIKLIDPATGEIAFVPDSSMLFRIINAAGIDPYYVSTSGINTILSFIKWRDSVGGVGNLRVVHNADSTTTGYVDLSAKLDKSDSIAATGFASHGRVTKVADSLATVFNASLATKVTNAGGAPSILEDIFANRPAAGTAGRLFVSTDTKVQYRDNVSSWDLIGAALDSTLFVTSTRLNKNAAGSDTLWHVIYGIPQPNGSGVNGTPITWSWLTTGGEHAFSPDLDSCLFVNSSGQLQIGFPTPMDVASGGLFNDEQTYPLKWQVIGSNDSYDFGAWIQQSGIGINIVGSGAGGIWSIQSASVGPYTFTIDTSTQGIISFDLVDNSSQYLGATSNGVVVTYNGANGYTLKRIFTGLTRAYKYQLLDIAGNSVIGQPASTDRLGITLGVSYHTFIDLRQFTSLNQAYFNMGLPNMWFIGVIKLQPDSLKIIRPVTFTATALTATTASVTWSAVSNAAGGYQLDRSTNPNFSGSVTTVYSGTGTSFSDSGLTTGTTYYYRIRAIRISGQYSGWKLRQITTP